MKALLFNPVILSLLLIFSAVCFFLVMHFTKSKKALRMAEKGIILIFLTIIYIGPASAFVGFLTPQSIAEANPVEDKLLLYGSIQFPAYAFAFFLLRSRFFIFFAAVRQLLKNPFLAGLILITVLSGFWSETPVETFRAGLVALGTCLFAAFIATRYDFRGIVNILLSFSTWITSLSTFLCVFIPSVGRDAGNWQGPVHKNILGAWMALTIILWGLNAIYQPKYRRSSILLATWSLILLALTGSGGAIVILLILSTLLILLQFLKRLSFRQASSTLIFSAIVGIPLMIYLPTMQTAILNSLGKDPTLTGRTLFWSQLIDAAWQKPLLGYGFYGFWQKWRGSANPARDIMNHDSTFVPTHAHNGFLDLLLCLGFIGLLLLILSFFSNAICILSLMYSNRQFEAEIAFLLQTFIIISNLTEPGLWTISIHMLLQTLLTVRLSLDVATRNVFNVEGINPSRVRRNEGFRV